MLHKFSGLKNFNQLSGVMSTVKIDMLLNDRRFKSVKGEDEKSSTLLLVVLDLQEEIALAQRGV